jgi:TolB protein
MLKAPMFRGCTASRLRKLTHGGRALRWAAAVGAVIAANLPAIADPLLQHPVLRTYQPVRIALPDFIVGELFEAEPAHVIWKIVASDLKQSGMFALIDQAVLVDANANVDEVPKFADWRAIHAEEIVTGRVTHRPDARMKVEFRLWEVATGTQLVGTQYVGTPADFNRIGHMISESIYEHVTGKKQTFYLRGND